MCIYGCTHKDTIHVSICTCEYVCVSVLCVCVEIHTLFYIFTVRICSGNTKAESKKIKSVVVTAENQGRR